jgi:ubiquinone/menaquinone biosynthesis C-methylase UbiE
MIQDIYSPLNKSAFYMIQRRQRLIRAILAASYSDVSKLKLLEIGCGSGQWFTEFQTYGFRVKNLSGIELDESRVADANERIIGADIRSGNAAKLPWEDNTFDIVFQSTVFTSIPNKKIQEDAAKEMMRVCKDNGFILWYDFMYNSPSNKNVKGVKQHEIKALFSPWDCKFKKITLAPPIARRLVPMSWLAAEFIETICPFLRTHLLVQIKK